MIGARYKTPILLLTVTIKLYKIPQNRFVTQQNNEKNLSHENNIRAHGKNK